MISSGNAYTSSSGVQNFNFNFKMGFVRLTQRLLFFPLRAFEQTAGTIVQVGRQGVVASLLRAEANALRIEACNEALTELISLFNVRPNPRFPLPSFQSNLSVIYKTRVCLCVTHLSTVRRHQLEEIVDVRRWQADLEVARVRDHHELLSMGHRIESGNAAINRELAQQGDTIAQVLRDIHVRTPAPPILLSNAPTHTQALTLRVCSLHVVCGGAATRVSTLVFRIRTRTPIGKHPRSQYRL